MREHRISSRGNKEQYLKLRMKLIAEGRSFASWLEEQIEKELSTEIKQPSSKLESKKDVTTVPGASYGSITFRSAPGPGIAGRTDWAKEEDITIKDTGFHPISKASQIKNTPKGSK